jgi:putative membrane protein
MNALRRIQRAKKEAILIVVLLIFYLVGIYGILSDTYTPSFLALSPFNLVLSFGIVLLARKSKRTHFMLFLIACFVIGFVVEYIGTQTGLLFGDYRYGANLGFKWMGVPLLIGINWGVLIVTAASIVNRLNILSILQIILSALLMVGLDFLMEPVAISSDFWSWSGGEIPFYNYTCWFFISLFLQYLYHRFKLVESNKVFDSLFIILILFFTGLNLYS